MISQSTIHILRFLGRLIRTARVERGLSQKALALRLNVTRQTVMHSEKGSDTVSLGVAFEAAYVLGVPLFSTDKRVLSKWEMLLSEFSGLLPKKPHRKKQVNDDF